MKNLHVLLVLLAVTFSLNIHAQMVTVETPDMIVDQGTTAEVEVKVEDFESMLGMQFAIFWDQEVLEYLGIKGFSLPGDEGIDYNFNAMNATDGKIRFNWIDPSLIVGETIADGTAIFAIEFKAIGESYSSTEVSIQTDTVHPAMEVEFSDTSGVIDHKIEVGTVTIDGVNATMESVTDDFTLFQNHPNPFADQTSISFYLNNSSQTQLSIYDHSGRIVFEKNGQYARGSHTIQVSRNLFQSTGSYFFTLKTENATATRQLVVQ